MEDKLREVFSQVLGMDASQVTDELQYAVAEGWDSVAHMSLIAAIEEAFDIMIDAEDVIDMSSFRKARDIVAKYL
ncbi:acyl carrier protein [Mitsuaria sp. WAJ17]|uniref:acyl carrier protein n=1 Tax=Mitsuaria sp. WAJ17 TaxID=2761452 RepID=UPI0016018B2B|nr:acyl carrier protein [Mitsuaria sp. WAJ17]MBB2486776.1 acyl carrier protein [Mitsuaria sp. WAJ17]